MKRKWNLSAEGKAVLLVVAVTALACFWATERQAGWADRTMRSELLHQAVAVAQTINPSQIATLSFTKADQGNPVYQSLCAQMAAYKSLINCSGICSVASRNDTLFFGPESYSPNDPQASPPGTPYVGAQPSDFEIFRDGRAFVRGPAKNEYGEYIYAVAPVIAPDTGSVTMAVAIDMIAARWHAYLRSERLFAGLQVMPLGMILIAGLFLLGKRKRLPDNMQGRLRHVEACIMALFSLTLTALIAWKLQEREHIDQHNVFSQLAANQAYRLASQFNSIRDNTLNDVARLYEASPVVTRNQFENLVSPLLKQNSLFGIAWIEPVRKEDRRTWELRAQAEGYPTMAIWELDASGKPIPAKEQKDVYYPVLHSAELRGVGLAAGFDAGSETLRRAAIEETCRTGLPTATPPLILATSSNDEKGILVYQPVFRGTGETKTLRGIVLVAFRPSFLITTTIGPMPPEALSSKITLHQLSEGAADPLFVATSEKGEKTGAVHSLRSGTGKKLSQTYPIFAFGRTYVMTCSPGEGFLSAYPVAPMWPVLATGFVISALLTLLTVFFIQRHTNLERKVQLRTKELQESENKYRLAEERERRLNKMLLAIRNVNQLIVREQLRDHLLSAACLNLTNTLDYLTVWIALVDERGSLISFTSSGLGENADALRKQLEAKHYPACMQSVLGGDQIIRTPCPAENCKGICALSGCYQDACGMTARIAFEDQRFGVLTVSVPSQFARDELATALFRELADDLGFALHKIATADALQESETRFRSLVEGAADAIFVCSADGKFVYLNPSAVTLFGATNGDTLIGAGIVSLFKPEQHDFITERIRLLIDKKAPLPSVEKTVVRPDGTAVDIEVSAVPIRFRGQDGAVVFARDISARKQAEEQRRNLEEQLHQSQKLESLGQLAGGVAHDFNNMLQVILGHAEMLLQDIETNSPHAETLREIQKAGQRAADLTRQLLAFARKQTIKPRPLDLNETVSDHLKILRRLIGVNIELLWHPGKVLPKVKMDPAQVNQLLTNLVINARDAIGEKGTITIETRQTIILDTDRSKETKLNPGPYTVLTITDNGQGMSKETLLHIFEPFFTTKPTGKGTGLGLSTVYGIVQQCNGHINVNSENGKGTAFHIFLPCCSEQEGTAAPQAKEEEAEYVHKNILLVEDEPSLLRFMRKLLEQMGHTVLAANCPQEALHIAQTFPDEIHLLLTDVIMSEMSGRELQQRLLVQHSKLKTLYISGYTAEGIVHHNELNQGVHFLQKPFSSSELENAMRDAFR